MPQMTHTQCSAPVQGAGLCHFLATFDPQVFNSDFANMGDCARQIAHATRWSVTIRAAAGGPFDVQAINQTREVKTMSAMYAHIVFIAMQYAHHAQAVMHAALHHLHAHADPLNRGAQIIREHANRH
jgi:hypothetical protein